jgi:transposase
MKHATTIGLDIAKSVFLVHGVDAAGQAVLRQKLSRSRVLEFFAKLPRCLVGIEACASSHYWSRELINRRPSDLTVVGFKMRPNFRQIDEAIDLAQEVIAWDMTLKAEAVKQRLLHHPTFAHHGVSP